MCVQRERDEKNKTQLQRNFQHQILEITYKPEFPKGM